MTKGRIAMGALYLVAGGLHFVLTPAYVRIMPPALPDPVLLVEISGVCEMLGGLGVLLPPTRRAAAWGLIALLIAVFPANLHMALHPELFPGLPVWLLWLRLPLQLPLIAWAWLYTRR
jgi:uncharacterized membrane protein